MAAVDGRAVDPTARPEKAGGIGCYRSHLAALAGGGGVRRHHACDRGRRHRLAGGAGVRHRRPRGDGAGTIRSRCSFASAIAPSVATICSDSPPPSAPTAGTPTPFPLDGLPIRSTNSYLVSQHGRGQGARVSRGRPVSPSRSTTNGRSGPLGPDQRRPRAAVPVVRGPGDRRAVVDPGRGPGPVLPAADFAAAVLRRPQHRRERCRTNAEIPQSLCAGARLLPRPVGRSSRRPRTSPDGRTSRAP